MRVRLASYISTLEGYFQGAVFYGYKDKFGLCYARDYVVPTLTSQNATFGSEAKAVTDTTWNAAAESFKADMQTYADAWNETQQPGREGMRNLTALNLFVRGCFDTATDTAFDLSTLTVANFGGEVGDLLGAEPAQVGKLISAASMPSCSLDLDTLNSPIEEV